MVLIILVRTIITWPIYKTPHISKSQISCVHNDKPTCCEHALHTRAIWATLRIDTINYEVQFTASSPYTTFTEDEYLVLGSQRQQMLRQLVVVGPNAMRAVPRQMDVKLNRATGQIPVLRATLLVLVANSNYATLISIVWELVFIRLSCAE
jgi:hypothetical protein